MGLSATPAARARSTCTSAGCARSCRCSPTRSRRSSSSATSSSIRARRERRTRPCARSLAAPSLGGRGRTLAVTVTLVSWSVRRSVGDRIERDARQRGAARGRNAVSPPACDAGRAISTPKPMRSGSFLGAGHLHRRRRPRRRRFDVYGRRLLTLENHATARRSQGAADGLGVARRYSATLDIDMLYVAVPVRNPRAGPRRSPPRLAADRESRAAGAAARTAFIAAGGAGLAVGAGCSPGVRRAPQRPGRAIADVARRYAAGDFSRAGARLRHDEIGTVARVLDGVDSGARPPRRRARADRARMEAILGGMVEGVLVVNAEGRVQLANAARAGCCGSTRRRRPALPRDRAPPRHRRADRARRSAAATGEHRAAAAAGRDRVRRARARRRRAHDRRGARAARHHRPPPRRSDPPRLRRQRLARAADAADRDPRLRRGAARRRRRPVGASVPRDHSRHTLRMERLVRDLLRLARLDAGQEPLEHVAVPGRTLFGGVEADLDAADRVARNAHVRHDIAPEAETVHGDPRALHDVLRNLLENAVNYSPEGRHDRDGAAARATRILLTVTDQGPASPKPTWRDLRALLPGRQGALARRARPGGTGLGLADRQAPGRAARRQRQSREPPAKGARSSRSSCRNWRPAAGVAPKAARASARKNPQDVASHDRSSGLPPSGGRPHGAIVCATTQ